MRRYITALLLATLVTVGIAAPTSAHEAEARVAGCGQTINAEYMACVHRSHSHSQYRNGLGTPGHTWERYQTEARQLRNYLIAVYVAAVRQALVDRWSGVARCESGGNWYINTGNGHYGGLQFSLSTWRAYGGSGYPHQHPPWVQATIAERVRAGQGIGAWPHCGRYY